MIEKYIAMKMFFEFKLPLILSAIVIGIWIFCAVIGSFISWFEKRQQKKNDEYYSGGKKEGES